MAMNDMLAGQIAAVMERLNDLPEVLLSPQSRLYWGYLLVTFTLALVLYLLDQAVTSRSPRDFLRRLLPREVYRHHSFRVDVQLKLFNHLLAPASWLAEAVSVLGIAGVISAAGHALVDGGPVFPGDLSVLGKIGIGLLVFMAYDFGMYVSHYLGHKFPLMWELHRVHHSAEHLNPLTTYRFHPLELVTEGLCLTVSVGLMAGVVGIFFDLAVVMRYFDMVHAWLFLRLFNLVGGNLRHMHIWWNWPNWLGHIISSPAQHQIHHSIERRHYGKNLASCFALWDWLFGTLYQPREREQLVFGVNEGVVHRHLPGVLLQPLHGMVRVLSGHDTQTPPSTGPHTGVTRR